MESIDIVFDNPKYYKPGDQVSGNVILITSADIKAHHLKIRIHGAAKTNWTKYSKNDNVTYGAIMDYIKMDTIVWSGDNQNNKLPAGPHVFPFLFRIPANALPNYEGRYGHVRYKISVELARPLKFSIKKTANFRVVPNVDISRFSLSSTKVSRRDVKDIGAFFKNGLVTLTVTIPNKPYIVGENLPITINIDNASTKPANCVRVELHQHSHFTGSTSWKLSGSNELCQKNEMDTVLEKRKKIEVLPKSRGFEELRIKIPRVSQTFQSSIMTVHYFLSVMLGTDTLLNNTLHCEFPIIISTVPITSTPVTPLRSARSASQPPPYSVLPPILSNVESYYHPPTYEEALIA
ncbi:hypothetical protein CRE_22444 [Caenorhabditis remanei]|uniref:Arrestin C-terminal-like domain-containing protein n=1 Tax=Caenorhabditis remanei TaxID=31234 RepID=E3ME71_CAERE|nr:hypothetical protein CRE_22444 [Caenorhabditis remanei]